MDGAEDPGLSAAVCGLGHQGFFTQDALEAIARTTVANVRQVSGGGACENEVKG